MCSFKRLDKKTCVFVLVFCAFGLRAESTGTSTPAGTGLVHVHTEQKTPTQGEHMMGKIDTTFKSVDQRFKSAVQSCHTRIVNKYHEIEEAYKKVGDKIARLSQSAKERLSRDAKITQTGK